MNSTLLINFYKGIQHNAKKIKENNIIANPAIFIHVFSLLPNNCK